MRTEPVKKRRSRKSSRAVGDEGDNFVLEYMKRMLKRVAEKHPRTFRTIYVHGKPIQVSADNDYHTCFDIKAEGPFDMIYAQVKMVSDGDGTVGDGSIAEARRKIDEAYPYGFFYIKIQIWLVWKVWVQRPGERRHKEYRFRVWQRMGFTEATWPSYTKRSIWTEITNTFEQVPTAQMLQESE